MLRSLKPHGKYPLINSALTSERSRPTSPGASFTFTFINSMGGSVVTSNALYFLTKQGFQFSQAMNFLLGALLGIAYIAGALGAKPILSWITARAPGVSSRRVLGWLMIVLALLCFLPQTAAWLSPTGRTGAWPIWTIVLLYSPATGMLWPIVESYISGGRSGRTLRSTMGRWNVVWSGAGLCITLLIAPFAENAASLAIFGIGLTHLAALIPLRRFEPEPGDHLDDEHEPHPPVYADLLVTFRLLLPLGYVVMSAIGPYLPSLAERLGLLRAWSPAGIAARVGTFGLLERWQGWHGRWYFALASGGLLLAGFAALVWSPSLPRSAAIPTAIAGLAAFGVAVASIYTAAIYYAMEVGKADVNAGGHHEALIGVGYTVGPGIGLAATAAVDHKWLPERYFEGTMLGTVGILAVLTALEVSRRVHRHTRVRA